MSGPSEVSQGTPTSSASLLHRVLFLMIAIFAVAGLILSAISVERHYAKSASNFCDFNQQFSCDVVNRSEYSSIIGIPVAGIGLAGYGVLLFLAMFRRDRAETSTQLLVLSLAGLVFALRLTYIEAYVLMTWCILCLASLAMISAISLLSIWLKVSVARS